MAVVTALQRMIAKGLKEPSDKIELLRVLDLGKVLAVLEERTRLARTERDFGDEEEEEFRESLAKVLATLGLELLDLTKEDLAPEIRSRANQMLAEIYPLTMHFIADEYDDTSQAIYPFVHALLLAVSTLCALNSYLFVADDLYRSIDPKIEKAWHRASTCGILTRTFTTTFPDTDYEVEMGLRR